MDVVQKIMVFKFRNELHKYIGRIFAKGDESVTEPQPVLLWNSCGISLPTAKRCDFQCKSLVKKERG